MLAAAMQLHQQQPKHSPAVMCYTTRCSRPAVVFVEGEAAPLQQAAGVWCTVPASDGVHKHASWRLCRLLWDTAGKHKPTQHTCYEHGGAAVCFVVVAL
jgi:hypothetical protein